MRPSHKPSKEPASATSSGESPTRAERDLAPARGGSSGEANGARSLFPAEVEGSSEQIVRLFEMTGDLLATVSPEGRFTLLNPAWEEALGWRREELLQRSLQELLHPDDVEQT